MSRYIKHRLASIPLVLVGVILINFFLYHLSPGDPSNLYFSPDYNQTSQQVLRQKMGLDRPLHIQLGLWFYKFIQGDFGFSWSRHRPVIDILKEAIPATLELAAISLLLNFLLGTTFGLIAGLHANKWFGKVLSFTSLLLYSIPSFWLAILLIYIFSLRLGWLPASGQSSLILNSPTLLGTIADHFRHLVMPAAVLGVVGGAATFRIVRANTLKILDQPFIVAARAKGLSPFIVLYKHALKNILLPVITLFGIYFPFLLGGALIIEVIFAWPGMGRITYEAILAKDFPVIMAINYIAALMVIFGNLIADVLNKIVDPRT